MDKELRNWNPMYLPPDFDAQDGNKKYDLMFTDGEQAYRVRECDGFTFESFQKENFVPKAWAFASDVMPSDSCFKREKRIAYNFSNDTKSLWHWLFDLRLHLIANMNTTNHETGKWQKALCTVYMDTSSDVKQLVVTNPHGLQETYSIFHADPEKEMEIFGNIIGKVEMQAIVPNYVGIRFWEDIDELQKFDADCIEADIRKDPHRFDGFAYLL